MCTISPPSRLQALVSHWRRTMPFFSFFSFLALDLLAFAERACASISSAVSCRHSTTQRCSKVRSAARSAAFETQEIECVREKVACRGTRNARKQQRTHQVWQLCSCRGVACVFPERGRLTIKRGSFLVCTAFRKPDLGFGGRVSERAEGCSGKRNPGRGLCFFSNELSDLT